MQGLRAVSALPAAEDTGNLIVLGGAIFAPTPVPGLGPAGAALAISLVLVSGVAAARRRSSETPRA
jgi:hypothetical protein